MHEDSILQPFTPFLEILASLHENWYPHKNICAGHFGNKVVFFGILLEANKKWQIMTVMIIYIVTDINKNDTLLVMVVFCNRREFYDINNHCIMILNFLLY